LNGGLKGLVMPSAFELAQRWARAVNIEPCKTVGEIPDPIDGDIAVDSTTGWLGNTSNGANNDLFCRFDFPDEDTCYLIEFETR